MFDSLRLNCPVVLLPSQLENISHMTDVKLPG